MTNVEERLIIRLNRVPLGAIIFLTKNGGILCRILINGVSGLLNKLMLSANGKLKRLLVGQYAQEQEFYRQTALISKKDKEMVELMQAVSFMYVRPPGTILKVLRLQR
ncbi:putative zinc finger CCHC domain-containing protein [Trifolium pratense]|uniref:Putative zinc finger CCHC domain-containing protein n=1 Tax=Trifolium pratense TaxID=57577 RepID=A0A2K3PPB0_TRIPR|nr:putative zinc finger CCHC domain-containing protein [Trifolium pratense]